MKKKTKKLFLSIFGKVTPPGKVSPSHSNYFLPSVTKLFGQLLLIHKSVFITALRELISLKNHLKIIFYLNIIIALF